MAWYPLDGFASDAGTYQLDGALEGPAVAEDRHGNPYGALSFDGVDDRVSIPHSDLTNPSVLTLSVWFKDSDFSNSDGQQSQLISKREFTGWGNAYEFGIGYPINAFPETPTIYSNFSVNGNHTIFHASDSIVENHWHQAVYSHGDDSLFIYLDGERVLAQTSPGPLPTNNELPTWFGGRPGDNGRNFYSGLLDDIGIWNRVLSDEEVLSLYFSEQPISGCIYPEACNYNPEAFVDDGSCELGTCQCLEGTVWSVELGGCVVVSASDTDFDGCVGMIDLLNLLSVFGTCVEVPWVCGDMLEYQGYDYATVQIGGQCWFAENLRAEDYSNGDPIPMIFENSEWHGATEGARCWINNDSTYFGFPGFLYHGYTVTDSRGVCPAMWHVADDSEWMELEIAHGLAQAEADEIGVRGGEIQLSERMRVESWGGTNELGFGAQKGGYRRWENGSFSGGIDSGAYWSMGETLNGPGYREFHAPWDGVARGEIGISEGLSIRCIQDSE